MSEPVQIEGEVIEEAEVAVVPHQPHEVAVTNLFGDASPLAVVERATEVAKALAAVIEDRKLYKDISGRKHVYVEGWTLLGSMLGVFPVVEWTRKLEDGWEAKVEARTLSGAVVGSAEAMCSRSESKWKSRDEYAIRSMAQTRGTSKALRLPLGFVMTLAGYDATPIEEMPELGAADRRPAAPADPSTVLPPSFPPGDDLGQRIGEALQYIDPEVDWRSTWEEANLSFYGKYRPGLDPPKKAESLVRLGNVAAKLSDAPDFPLPTDAEIAGAFSSAFGGVIIKVQRHEPSDDADAIEFGAPPDADQGS